MSLIETLRALGPWQRIHKRYPGMPQTEEIQRRKNTSWMGT
jgi:hypothetical protein